MLYIYKFEGNRDRRTRCTKCWSNITLKCYTNTFVKDDARIALSPISYLKGYSYLKLYCKKLTIVVFVFLFIPMSGTGGGGGGTLQMKGVGMLAGNFEINP